MNLTPVEGKDYTIGLYAERPHYRCAHKWGNGDPCPVDSLDLADLEEHIVRVHLKPTIKDPRILLYGPDGEPVYKPEDDSDDSEE